MKNSNSFTSHLLQDYDANVGRSHIQLLLILFRASQRLRQGGKVQQLLAKPLGALYRLIALSLFGIDIPISTHIGAGFTIHHGMGLVIHNSAVLGNRVIVRQNVTIGSRHSGAGAPRVGDAVSFGAGAIALGEISIGNAAQVGAGAVVLKPVPDGFAAVGNPARLLERS